MVVVARWVGLIGKESELTGRELIGKEPVLIGKEPVLIGKEPAPRFQTCMKRRGDCTCK